MKLFKKDSVKLLPGGYLVDAVTEQPVTHTEFVAAQRKAHYFVELAKVLKTKSFVTTSADSLDEVLSDFDSNWLTKPEIKFVATKSVSQGELTTKLQKEALNFIQGQVENATNNNLNKFMQKFEVIYNFENVGLYFDNGVTQLSKLYTIDEIMQHVKPVIQHLSTYNK